MKKDDKSIKAIETEYNGHEFRSRLEARWAVAFDGLNGKWDYEIEGFKTPDGTWYLPDFLLHDVVVYEGKKEWTTDLWVEIKPRERIDKECAQKLTSFADKKVKEVSVVYEHSETGEILTTSYNHGFPTNPIILLTQIPSDDQKRQDFIMSITDEAYTGEYPVRPFSFELIDGYEDAAFIGIDKKGRLAIFKDVLLTRPIYNIDYEGTRWAFDRARKARFEHGETPDPISWKKVKAQRVVDKWEKEQALRTKENRERKETAIRAWKTFFNKAGAFYQENNKIFSFEDGTPFKPDLKLSNVPVLNYKQSYILKECYVVIEPDIKDLDGDRIERFVDRYAHVDNEWPIIPFPHSVLVLTDVPKGNSLEEIDQNIWRVLKDKADIYFAYPFNFLPIDGYSWSAYPVVLKSGEFALFGGFWPDLWKYNGLPERDEEKTLEAFKAAQAEYEENASPNRKDN